MQTPRERALSAKTLICFLQSLIDTRTTIELRDDSQIEGVIKSVDSFMNIELNDVCIRRPLKSSREELCDYLFVNGTKIRYVSIPDEVDALKAIDKQIASIRGYSQRGITKNRELSRKKPSE
ncbi:U7 snRNA-associated Sm-like protein LSm10 [Dinothrombium tinctorium]|uniref:U7 snRNA-associated Sm-like protein LSm10 n=1 Tax=Dinothrombium tinctorium TaxID=1965070 RepID=A0A3S5WGU8_9ACAR|nr:U7 snRNA-associated Sm-like protein LSm10 [Dinothrombium tinctorium]RWS07741.1 U7 snRNA-associated Sm-like protein LSm10 [Dinothrombium tinctorium]